MTLIEACTLACKWYMEVWLDSTVIVFCGTDQPLPVRSAICIEVS